MSITLERIKEEKLNAKSDDGREFVIIIHYTERTKHTIDSGFPEIEKTNFEYKTKCGHPVEKMGEGLYFIIDLGIHLRAGNI